ncbi:hypothetical protein CPB83DRAFT_838809 [Crepidotus variabilis]|uniref:Uncharacterized protein n=1 Tax=Crepidotus variabilis TaxID=179855 RepID=A0A9P6E8V5_9AGAR|nr:hypothetical protein CPB83DRAFT_838809 [Crepidotus variabilis]
MLNSSTSAQHQQGAEVAVQKTFGKERGGSDESARNVKSISSFSIRSSASSAITTAYPSIGIAEDDLRNSVIAKSNLRAVVIVIFETKMNFLAMDAGIQATRRRSRNLSGRPVDVDFATGANDGGQSFARKMVTTGIEITVDIWPCRSESSPPEINYLRIATEEPSEQITSQSESIFGECESVTNSTHVSSKSEDQRNNLGDTDNFHETRNR